MLARLARAGLGAALLALSGCGAQGSAPPAESAPLRELGLMGSIPIYWGETDNFGALLGGEGAAHWARAQLESGFRLRLLDVLSAENLDGLRFLLLAQPRPLNASENLALDNWVREGGRLLLFADPLLTGESRFAIGDRRRPQDAILLSPILGHWGLELQFDIEQPSGTVLLEEGGAPIPVNLPGRFALTGDEHECTVLGGEVLARCAIGAGSVWVLADAAMLDLYDRHAAAPAALAWLVDEAFGERGK